MAAHRWYEEGMDEQRQLDGFIDRYTPEIASPAGISILRFGVRASVTAKVVRAVTL